MGREKGEGGGREGGERVINSMPNDSILHHSLHIYGLT